MYTTDFPLVTVAMVTYNSEKYLKNAIESVLSSNYPSFELIICDDNSTDKTWRIIQDYLKRSDRIRAYRNIPNLGEYKNRNKSIEHAKGKYLIYIDGDDILYPHGLGIMVENMERFPNAAMALARTESDHIIYPYEMTPAQIFRYDYLGRGITTDGLTATMFRIDVLRKVGGFSSEYIAGDTFIKKKISLEHNSVLISNGLSWWRRTPGQASEKLLKGNLGLVESYNYNTFFLADPKCPLTVAEKEITIKFLKSRFARTMVKSIVKLDLKTSWNMFKSSKFKLRDMMYVFCKYVPSHKEGSSDKPLMSGGENGK